MDTRKRIALIAHANMKRDIFEWARYNRGTLSPHELYGTGTTGGLIAAETGLDVARFRSGPLGGDQQVGAGVAEGRIDFIIFFTSGWLISLRQLSISHTSLRASNGNVSSSMARLSFTDARTATPSSRSANNVCARCRFRVLTVIPSSRDDVVEQTSTFIERGRPGRRSAARRRPR
jgi:hypothetical protein